jgi:TonB family protein
MNISDFFYRLFHFQIPGIAATLLIMLSWSIPSFCGEIHDAAAAGNLEEIKALLEKNPELVSSKDERDWMPLHAAAWNGRTDAAELLLARGADVNAKNNKGETPLHLAAQKTDRRMVELLRVKNADVKAKDDRGKTPLEVASEFVADLLRPDELVTQPVALSAPLVPYTEEARRALACPYMLMQATIRADGTVDNIKVIKEMGYGMDEAAINTFATKWRFKPATKSGVPIDMNVTIEVKSRCF